MAKHGRAFGGVLTGLAMTCGLAQADLLVILSDVDGVYEVDDAGEQRRFTTRISQIEAMIEKAA